MMNESIPLCASMGKELDCLLSVFTVPSGQHFLALAAGWVLGRGRRTITAMLRAADLSSGGHYSSYYRFFSKAAWSAALLWRAWATMLISMFYPTGDVFCCGDDTLLKHRGSSQDYRKDPWYSSREHASFRDMLVALRSASLREHISCMSTLPAKTQKIVRRLLQAAAEAA